MKKLTPLLLISVLFLSACSATYHGSALYDDVYYGATEVAPVNNVIYEQPEYIDTDYEYEGEEYLENRNTQDSLRSDYNAPEHFGEANYYEYMNDEPYEIRLLRFHGPSWRYRYAYSYYDPYYMYDQYDYFGSNNFLFMGWPNHYRNRLYIGSPLGYLFDWTLTMGFGFGFNNFGWGSPYYGGYGGYYGGYGGFYGGYGGYYGGYGGYYGGGYGGHYGGAYQGYYPSTRGVQYGQRNTRGQINSRNVIQTPRDARGYTTRTKDNNTGTNSIRGTRTTQTEHRGSSGLVGNLQQGKAKTTPKRTRSSITNTNGSRGSYGNLNRKDQNSQRDARSRQDSRSITNNNRLAKTANSNSREQQINGNRQRYTRTSPKYNKPGSYTSPNSRTGTSSRQYTSPQRNTRSTKFTTQTRSSNQSLRKVTGSATKTQRYSSPSRSNRNVKSYNSNSKSKSGASRSTSRSTSRSGSGSVRSGSGGRSSSGSGGRSSSGSSSSGSSSSGSRGKR